MALQVLAFRTSARIGRATRNVPALGPGARGMAVVILQRALIDYGCSLPRSSTRGGPDGIYGDETRGAVRRFQADTGLGTDGIGGTNTFRVLDRAMTLGPKAQRPKRMTLHFRSLSLTDIPFETQFRAARDVFAQGNIEVMFGSGLSMGLSEEEAEMFDKLQGTCNCVITTGEYAELLQKGRNVPPTQICVFYINTFDDSDLLGCGGHLQNHPACILAARANLYDMAHEVCHVLLTSAFTPTHHTSPANLMHPTQSIYPTVPELDGPQMVKLRASPLLA